MKRHIQKSKLNIGMILISICVVLVILQISNLISINPSKHGFLSGDEGNLKTSGTYVLLKLMISLEILKIGLGQKHNLGVLVLVQ